MTGVLAGVLGLLIGLAIGALAGKPVTDRMSSGALNRGFAVLLVLVGVSVGVESPAGIGVR